jgi:branched-chain amino acid transport system permease protein
MIEFIQLLVQGISLGACYALLALAFAIVFRASHVLNFAQGAMLLLGAYLVSYFAVDRALPFGLAVAGAMAALIALGVAFHRVVLVRLAGAPEFIFIMVTLGAGIVITATVELFFGPNGRQLGDPWGSKALAIGAVTSNQVRLWAVVVTVVTLTAYFVFERRTTYGLATRAAAMDQEAAAAVGVPVRRTQSIAWAFAAFLSVLGGIFLAGYPNSVHMSLGDAALRAFPAVIVGGLGSPVGAVVGGLSIGIIEVMVAGYAPPWTGANANAVAPYVAMMVLLVIRPHGLFGTPATSRV